MSKHPGQRDRVARSFVPSLLVVAVLGVIAPAHAVAPYGLDVKPALQGSRFPDLPPGTGAAKVDRIFHQLVLNDGPNFITTAPGDNSTLYLASTNGYVWRIPNKAEPAASEKVKVLDISAESRHEGEEGLLGLALDPDFATNQFFYVYYAPAGGERRTQVSRFKVGLNALVTKQSEKVLFSIPQYTAYHKGGCMQFGPDGKLYLATGDGGQGPHAGNPAQNVYDLHGKILRFNADGTAPADNPFLNASGFPSRVWATGFRNPWRCSFDGATGDLWVGDVGEGTVEEIDIVRKGKNYGWPVYEGDRSYVNPGNLPPSAFEPPVFVYRHSGTDTIVGQAVTGGYVYRGSAIPSLAGKYVFADFVTGEIWALTRSNGQVTGIQKLGTVANPASLGSDAAGNLFVIGILGQVYKINPGATGSLDFPTKLSETGLFTDLINLTPTTGLVEYEINAAFWSDGAQKRRWVGMPSGTIGFSPMEAWSLPFRSVLVKHFEMPLASGVMKRLETRVLVNQTPGWRGYTYRWNDAGTDATLIDNAQSVELDVMDSTSPTGARRQTYEFPSRGACMGCHNGASGAVLGMRALQFHRNHQFANGVVDNQLRAWDHVAAFNATLGDLKYYTAIVDPKDTTKSLAARARSYLDVNCSQCHRPGGPTPVNLDFRAFTPYALTNAMDVAPASGNLGIADARRIAPGSKERSIVWQRMRALDGNRMPPLGSHAVDQAGVALIGAWIDAGAQDGYAFGHIRPMFGGTMSGSRTGLGDDTIIWNFDKAQQCTLTMTNAANTSPKNLGTFPGVYTYRRSGPALKNTYTLSCRNPYAVDVRSLVIK